MENRTKYIQNANNSRIIFLFLFLFSIGIVYASDSYNIHWRIAGAINDKQLWLNYNMTEWNDEYPDEICFGLSTGGICVTYNTTNLNMSGYNITDINYLCDDSVCYTLSELNQVGVDTNVTTQCSGSNVPLGNGSCISMIGLGGNTSDEIFNVVNNNSFYPYTGNPSGYLVTETDSIAIGLMQGNDSRWSSTYNDSYYLNTNPSGFYNVTTLPAASTPDNTSWNESYANILYYNISNPSGFYNVTTLPTYPSETDAIAISLMQSNESA